MVLGSASTVKLASRIEHLLSLLICDDIRLAVLLGDEPFPMSLDGLEVGLRPGNGVTLKLLESFEL